MSEINLFNIVIFVVLFGSGWVLFGSLFSTSSNSEERPPPKNYKEARQRREERQRRIKKEYEEKKALKLKARLEKDKLFQEKKEKLQREKEEKKRIKRENKKPFFSWLKPKVKKETIGNKTYIIDSSKVEKFVPPLFGSSDNSENNPINEKMDNLLKKLDDL